MDGRPEQLWILNPKQILRKLELEPAGAAVDRDEERKLQDAREWGGSPAGEGRAGGGALRGEP